jgi:amidohydrolase
MKMTHDDLRIAELAAEVEPRVIEWRRDIHRNPELGNREFRTAALVAEHLTRLGMQVRTKVAHTGVIGLLGRADGQPVVALRADMDALPVTEAAELPFASSVRASWNGEEVGVMHACGHDAHVAILMGVAEVFSRLGSKLPGAVKFLFQPAEEGPPAGERGGAQLMIEEGALDSPSPSVILGLHVTSRLETGTIGLRNGPLLAAVDSLRIVVRGRQTHAAYPWLGVDPIVAAAQIILALQTIPSRQLDLTVAPAILSIGSIRGGVRGNIIPDQVEMVGTIRSLDETMREEIHRRVARTARSVAEASGAVAEVLIEPGYPATVNDPVLTQRMLPVLRRVAGPHRVLEIAPVLGAEDFAFFQKRVPGLFFFLGARPAGVAAEMAPPNHSPRFFVDEAALRLGVETLAELAVDYLRQTS